MEEDKCCNLKDIYSLNVTGKGSGLMKNTRRHTQMPLSKGERCMSESDTKVIVGLGTERYLPLLQ